MIVHVAYDCTPGRYRGGVSKVVFELATAQSKTREVQIWACDENLCGKIINFDGLQIRYFRPFRLGGVFFGLGLEEAFTGLASRISVIHGHNTFHPLNYQIRAIARRHNKKLFFHTHGALDPSLFSGFGVQALKKKLYIRTVEVPNLNQADGVFALTSREAQQLQSIGVISKIEIVGNGVSLPLDRRAGRHDQDVESYWGIRRSAKLILYVGRINRKKGLEFIFNAFNILRNKGIDIQLVLAGDHARDVEYTRYLRDILGGDQSDVIWTGFLDEKQKPALFSIADVFVHSSFSEGMAVSILEAMSYGLPVVATPGCYMRDAHEAGALVEVEQNPTEIADAIEAILASSSLASSLKSGATDFIAKNHGWSGISDRIFSVYDC